MSHHVNTADGTLDGQPFDPRDNPAESAARILFERYDSEYEGFPPIESVTLSVDDADPVHLTRKFKQIDEAAS